MRVIVEKIGDGGTTSVFDSDDGKNKGEEEKDFEDIEQKLPAALWGEGQGNDLNEKDAVLTKKCGKKLSIKGKLAPSAEELFPYGDRWISLSELYNNSYINFGNSFKFLANKDFNPKYFKNTIIEFQTNEDNGIANTRIEFLKEQGKTISEDISIKDFVKNADYLLSEEIVIIEE